VPKEYNRVKGNCGKTLRVLDNGLEIIPVGKDVGPYCKLFYALNGFNDPETIIITIDDDVNYPKNWLENLLKASEKYPDYAIGYRGRSFTTNEINYNKSKVIEGKKSTNNLLTSLLELSEIFTSENSLMIMHSNSRPYQKASL
jgi:hypothetical protein